MAEQSGGPSTWPAEQRAIWERCRHPSGTVVDFPPDAVDRSILERFAEQVRRHAARPAILDSNGALTYEALDRRANAVARALLVSSAEPGEPIALLLERDAGLVVSILGVLKAGKLYVPLDAALPDDRLAALLHSAGVRLVIAGGALAARGRALAARGYAVLDLDALDPATADDPEVAVAPGAGALVLYTSGSTARPKGVLHTHANVLQMVMNHTRHLHICAEDRITLLFSPAFVGAVSDVFGALLNGAAVCPIDPRREGLRGLVARLESDRVTIYHSVTTMYRQLAQSLSAGADLRALRLLHVGGEPVTPQDLDLYRDRFSPSCVFLNMLGTTETGNFRIYYVDKSARPPLDAVPVGYSFDGKDVLLLDEAGGPVPSGAVGEIVVRSRYLSPGYWREPALTEAAFRQDPHDATSRRYHTGDLGRMRADGCLEHRGRRDQQAKIRGYRVDVAAVEAALREHPAVKEAAVIVETGAAGRHRLVAYVVPTSTPAPTTGALRDFAASRLADYMVPAAFVALESLPLTHTGKVDRRELPGVRRVRPDLSHPPAPPRSPLETALASIWAEVLELDGVGIHDTFVELGGDSLQALQVADALRAIWRVTLSQRALLEASTVERMARAVLDALAESADAGSVAAQLSRMERPDGASSSP